MFWIPVVQELIARGANLLTEDEDGHNPALACAPNPQVADCLALILVAMVPSLGSPLATSARLDNSEDHSDEEDGIDFATPTHNATVWQGFTGLQFLLNLGTFYIEF